MHIGQKYWTRVVSRIHTDSSEDCHNIRTVFKRYINQLMDVVRKKLFERKEDRSPKKD